MDVGFRLFRPVSATVVLLRMATQVACLCPQDHSSYTKCTNPRIVHWWMQATTWSPKNAGVKIKCPGDSGDLKYLHPWQMIAKAIWKWLDATGYSMIFIVCPLRVTEVQQSVFICWGCTEPLLGSLQYVGTFEHDFLKSMYYLVLPPTPCL